MSHYVESLVRNWTRATRAPERQSEMQRIDRLAQTLVHSLFSSYLPNRGSEIENILQHWLASASDDDDRRVMYESLTHLFFVGEAEYAELCRIAYRKAVPTWLIEKSGVHFDSPAFVGTLNDLLKKTFFVAFSDSAEINKFITINGISQSNRPELKSLDELGALPNLAREINQDPTIHSVVIIEDFIGSGDQASEIIWRLSKSCPKRRFLFLPFVACPEGIQAAQARVSSGSNLDVQSIVILSELQNLVRPSTVANEDSHLQKLRDVAKRTWPLISAASHSTATSTTEPASPFGHKECGALYVRYTNCPDNTLPLYHHQSTRWAPLFRRNARDT